MTGNDHKSDIIIPTEKVADFIGSRDDLKEAARGFQEYFRIDQSQGDDAVYLNALPKHRQKIGVQRAINFAAANPRKDVYFVTNGSAIRVRGTDSRQTAVDSINQLVRDPDAKRRYTEYTGFSEVQRQLHNDLLGMQELGADLDEDLAAVAPYIAEAERANVKRVFDEAPSNRWVKDVKKTARDAGFENLPELAAEHASYQEKIAPREANPPLEASR